MCPIVPTFTCGFVRSYFAFAIVWPPRGGLAGPGARRRLAGDLGHDLFGDRGRDLLVSRELHRVGRAPLRHRPHLRRVPEHLPQRHRGANDLRAAARLHRDDPTAAAVQIPDDRAHVLLGRHDLDVHHGLEQHGLGAPAGFLEADRRGDLERHLRRVDVVVRAVGEPDLDVHHRVAGEHAGVERLADTLLDGGNVLPRYRAADDLVLELEALPRVGLDLEVDVAVLAAAARLSHVAPLRLRGLTNGLAVRDLGLADVGLDPEFAQEAVDDDLQVKLAHAVDQRLARLLVAGHPERRVFQREPRQGYAELLLVGPRLGLDRHRDHRLGEGHRLQHDRPIGITQGVAGGRELQPDGGRDVAGRDGLALFLLVRVHPEQSPDPLLLVLGRVVHARARLERAGVHTEEDQLADVLIVHDLEGQRRERRVVGRLPLFDLFGLGIDALDRRDVQGRRQVVDHRIQQRLHALVLEGRAAEDRKELHADRTLAHGRLQLGGRDRLAVYVLLHQVLVDLGEPFDHFLSILLDLLLHVRWDLDFRELLAQRVIVVGPHQPDLVDQVDEPPVLVLAADRDLQRDRMGAQTLPHQVDALVVVRADAVHLVDVDHPRHPVLVGLPPHRFRLRLDARDSVEDRHGAVQDAERALDLDREVDVAGRVDDVDAAIPPEAGRRGRRDRDAALLLLHHPVHRRGAFVNLADLVRPAGVVQDPLGRRRLARVDMGHDADVARLLQGVLPFHVPSPAFSAIRDMRRGGAACAPLLLPVPGYHR